MTHPQPSMPAGGRNTDARHWGPLNTEIRRVDPKSLKKRELNARFMEGPEYQQLVANIKTDGKPTSNPLVCLMPNGDLEILSGHHRTMACIDAGIAEIDVIVILDPIDEERKRALQLSHNAITGKDNPGLLQQLFQGPDLSAKKYSGLTKTALKTERDSPRPSIACGTTRSLPRSGIPSIRRTTISRHPISDC